MSFIIENILNFFFGPFKKTKDNKCSICLQDNNKEKTILDCEHHFHVSCIEEWKRRSDTCPICRKKISIKKFEQYKRNFFLRIIVIISILIFFLSLIKWTRTHSGIKLIVIKIYNINKEIFKNFFDIVKGVIYIFVILIKGLYSMIKQSGVIIGYNCIRAIKIIYYLISLIVIIVLSSLMIIVNAIIDIMNLIIAIDESIFKIL